MMDGKGKGKAKGAGAAAGSKLTPAQKLANGEPLYTGIVKNFFVEKNHGFVTILPSGTEMDGQDVYVFANVLEKGGAGPGDQICFFLYWNAKGQGQVSMPTMRMAAADGECAQKGVFKKKG